MEDRSARTDEPCLPGRVVEGGLDEQPGWYIFIIIISMPNLRRTPIRRPLVWLLIILCILFVLVLSKVTWNTDIGGERGDFLIYWSSTSLLRDGLNPYDPALMHQVVSRLTHLDSDYTPMAWNPPTLFIFLLPLTLISYPLAKFIFLLLNIAIVAIACLMLASIYFPHGWSRNASLLVLFTFTLPQVLAGLFVGQVVYIVYLGVIVTLLLIKSSKWFWAGFALVLTTIKPHLVILVYIYVLLLMVYKRQYKGLAGIALSGVLSIIILSLFRSTWFIDMIGLMQIAPVNWETPTIGGFFNHFWNLQFTRYIIVFFLPLPFVLAHKNKQISPEVSVALLTLITIPITLFGWSFDQILLLIPMTLIFSWMTEWKKNVFLIGFSASIFISTIVNWSLRLFGVNDLLFLWFPLFCWLLYGAAWWLHRKRQGAINHPAGAA